MERPWRASPGLDQALRSVRCKPAIIASSRAAVPRGVLLSSAALECCPQAAAGRPNRLPRHRPPPGRHGSLWPPTVNCTLRDLTNLPCHCPIARPSPHRSSSALVIRPLLCGDWARVTPLRVSIPCRCVCAALID